MSELTTIKAKTKNGHIQDFQVAEILEVDGKPFQPAGDVEQLKSLVNHITGRIAAIEAIIGGNSERE